METLLFDPTDKSGTLTLDQLDRTLKFEDAGGKLPASAPIHHATLIKNISEIAAGVGKKIALSPITVKQSNCKRVLWKGPDNECPIENYAVERLVVKIGIGGTKSFEGIEDAEGSMAVGISYTEKGIQIAFGHNVKVCQNLNVFGEQIFSTFGTSKTPFEKGMQLIEHWMQNISSVQELNRDCIAKLQNVQIGENDRLRILGKIYEYAVRANEGDKTVVAPLNVTECNRMVAAGFDTIVKGGAISAWNMTNWATSVLKPESSDMVNLMTKNALLNRFLMAEVGLN